MAAWLHTAAYRVARKTQVRSWRRGAEPLAVETPDSKPAGDVAQEVSSRELLRLVDEEIARLPLALRGPLVLCCLEGKARDEAAQALGCSVAAVKSGSLLSVELADGRFPAQALDGGKPVSAAAAGAEARPTTEPLRITPSAKRSRDPGSDSGQGSLF